MIVRGSAIVLAIVAGTLIGHHWHSRAQRAALSGRAVVIDGDTIKLGDVHIRLYGIDAPETDQSCSDGEERVFRCGISATTVLETLIGNQPVVCTAVDTDRYGRTVATCEANGRDLGEAMVRGGFAVDYTRYSGGKYAPAQLEARQAKRGIWAGTFVEPEAWRHRR